MILNNADNIKLGVSQVNKIYAGSNLVWPLPTSGFWTFNNPSPGTTITNFSVTTTSGNILIDWGDGTQDTVNSGVNTNKTY